MNLNFTLILQILSFLILLGLLVKFLYKPLTQYLDERAKKIRGMTEEAQAAQEKARLYAEDTHKALEMAKDEALRIKNEAKRVSDSERRKVVAEAKREAQRLIEEAKTQLGREKEQVVKDLRQDIADISLDIAKKILGREIGKEDHKRIIDDSIKEIEDVFTRP